MYLVFNSPIVRKLLSGLGFFFSILILLAPTIVAQNSKQIEILKSDLLRGNREGQEYEKLIGNVILKHDDVLLYCDSAHRFKSDNNAIAYGNVKLNQGDTLILYTDTLYYNGNTSKSKARNNVVLIDPKTELRTNYLDVDFESNISHFFNGGTVKDSINTLVSQEGYYFSNTHDVHFVGQVDLQTPDYLCKSDTLFYNTETKIAEFFGPTEIFNDTSYMYGKIGYYHTELEFIKLGKDCYIEKEEWTIEADSIFYNQSAGIGKAMKNVRMKDTLQQIIVTSHFAFFDENNSSSFASDSALFMQYDKRDTLFLHADTLYFDDSEPGTKILKAYYHTKFFRYDMQGKCDSLVYNTRDSVINLYGEPIIWNEQSQLTANFMKILIKDQKANKIELDESAFIVTKQDSLHYDQIAGKHMLGYIRNNSLFRIDVDGNAQTIYFPLDGKDIMGLNSAESSNLIIWMDMGEVIKLSFINTPEGLMLPENEIKPDDSFLKGFQWLDRHRPKSKNGIFLRDGEQEIIQHKEPVVKMLLESPRKKSIPESIELENNPDKINEVQNPTDSE